MDLIRYQNANQSDEEIINNFIIRTDEFESVMDDIHNTKEKSSFQHYVFIGRRGSGKSTLLRRIQAEINTKPELSDKYVVVNLSEEQSGIYKLYDLMDYVIRDLNAIGYQIEKPDFRKFKNDTKEYTKSLHAIIISNLRSNKKRLILLIDNIDRVFDSIGQTSDAALLRELLMNFKDIRMIGASTVMSEQFWRYDMPFYEFFSLKRLERLSLSEIKKLLQHWANEKKMPEVHKLITQKTGKLQSIRMLTDGMPRTMLLFMEMLINRPNQNGYAYLQQIVDKATPIYQERLAVLSPAQRKVLTELALFWDAATVEQLVPVCNMDGKTISALLNQLVQNRYVEKLKGRTKNLFYRLEERFFNLWFVMTQGGPQQRMEAKALTDFLEKWYDQNELDTICFEISRLYKGRSIKNDYAEAMTSALLNSKSVSDLHKSVLYTTAKKSNILEEPFLQKYKIPDYNAFDEVDKAINSREYEKALALLELSDLPNGLDDLGRALCYVGLTNFNEAKKYYLMAIEKGNSGALNNLGNLYKNQGQDSDAEKYYLKAIEKGYSGAIFNLANLYDDQGKVGDAEKYYLMAIEKGDSGAMFNLAILNKNQGKVGDAEKYYLMAIEKGDSGAMNNLAILYKNQGKARDAERYFLMAIEKGLSEAMFNLANLYKNQGKFEESEKYYLMAIEKGHSGAMFNLAILYDDQGKAEDAERYYLMAIEKGLSGAMNNLAILYKDQGKAGDAEKYYLMAIEKGHSGAMFNLANLYDDQGKVGDAEKYYLIAIEKGHSGAMFNLANLYDDQGKVGDAEKYYLIAIEKGHSEAMNNLAILNRNQGDFEVSEKYYLMAIERGNEDAIPNLILLYCEVNNIKKLERLISNADVIGSRFSLESNNGLAALVYLTLGDMDAFSKYAEFAFAQDGHISEYVLFMILVHKQVNWVLNYFKNKEDAKQNYKPLYYAALVLQGGSEQELLVMPPEIEENVNDVVRRVIEKQNQFSGASNT
ncbi:MAG: tetratricopeptide repeat protein [Bacteroidetes bacterium]|nr:tetratricopeptide repeat protein [Bacteroidota bacterium]